MNYSVFSTLETGHATILTSNTYLAQQLRYQYAKYQIEKRNKAVWETPNIFPLSTWLKILWRRTESTELLLSSLQESLLWKEISQQHWCQIHTLQNAWEKLQLWNISLDTIKAELNDTTARFYQWTKLFIQTCHKNQWITASQIPQHLLLSERITQHLPNQLFLIGFDHLPALINQLLQSMKAHCNIEAMTSLLKSESTSVVSTLQFKNTESELIQMALWAHHQYQADEKKKIGCIIPNLTSIKQTVTRIFNNTFSDNTVFNISTKRYFSESGMIQIALNILEEKWEHAFQSPYLALSSDDEDFAAMSDKMRRDQNVSYDDESLLLAIFMRLKPKFPESTYIKRWKQLNEFKKKQPKVQSLSQWMQHFIRLLQIMQWPGSRLLNHSEKQIFDGWLELVEALTQCDPLLCRPIHQKEAFTILNHYTRTTTFQERNNHQASIQVLDIAETSGLSFDRLWIAGVHNQNYPAYLASNPFLPHPLQAQHKIPKTSPEQVLDDCQRDIHRLLFSAKTVYLSSPEMNGDQKLSPSQLVTSILNELEKQQLITQTPSHTLFPQEKSHNLSHLEEQIESIEDAMGSPMIPSNKAVKGGLNCLKYQSLCAFRAYATFRLKTDKLNNPRLGLSPQLKGQWLHKCLERFWRKIKTQASLQSLSHNELEKFIKHCIDHTVQENPLTLNERVFLNTEKKRLSKLLYAWLSLEKKRSPFSVVEQESERHFIIGRLSYRCRIDRIDQLSQGQKLVIDYKSGACQINDWLGERPLDPQLPIYCACSDTEPYDGLAFAQVTTHGMQLKGITSEYMPKMQEDNLIPITKWSNKNKLNNWHNMTRQWKTTVYQLSAAFYKGESAVNPLPSACLYCELQPLCRVKE